MPNPSGTDHDRDSDPVTEVIEIGDAGEAADTATGERRYTAPGFDAGSTQIIDRVPDAETEFISTEASGVTDPRPRTAGPQVITPQRPSRHRPYIGSSKVTQEDMVRSAITTFDTAGQKGDLATLRSVTCGQTRDNYVNYDDAEWADTYAKLSAAKQYPVVASIDEVIVDGEHAEANVTSYMASDPATTSIRSFDLQFRDDQWKICQSS